MFSKVLQTESCNHHLISNDIDIEGFFATGNLFHANGRERKKGIYIYIWLERSHFPTQMARFPREGKKKKKAPAETRDENHRVTKAWV